MWISYFNWFLALVSISMWIGAFVLYEKQKVMDWLGNKFGRDDPMPPSPNVTENIKDASQNKNTINFE